MKSKLGSEDNKLNEQLGFEGNPSHVNAIAAAKGMKEQAGIHEVFFKPDSEFVDWIIDYADGRAIVEVGCGSCHFLNLINRKYNRVIGIEPLFDTPKYMNVCMMDGRKPMHIVAKRIEECEGIVGGLEEKALIVLARPSHTGMVEATIEIMSPRQELLYITKPENLDRHNDLGAYRDDAESLEHRGTAQDNEQVLTYTK